MSLGIEPTVTLVNRVVDADGRKVPYEYVFDGQSGEIVESMLCPYGAARILVHHSMYRINPETREMSYKLGCPEMGLPTDPISESEVLSLNELIDRAFLGEKGRVKTVQSGSNVRQRHIPISVDGSGGDRAFPGTFSAS